MYRYRAAFIITISLLVFIGGCCKGRPVSARGSGAQQPEPLMQGGIGGVGVPELARVPLVIPIRGKHDENNPDQFTAYPGEMVVFPIVWSLPIEDSDILRVKVTEQSEVLMSAYGTHARAAQGSLSNGGDKGPFIIWFLMKSKKSLDAEERKGDHVIEFTIWNDEQPDPKKKLTYKFKLNNEGQ